MNIRHRLNLFATLLTAVLAGPAISADAPAKVAAPAKQTVTKPLAKVNGVPISHAAAEALVRDQLGQGNPDTPDLRKAVREQLIGRELVAQAAKKKGFDKKPEYAIQVELMKQDILINAFMREYVRSNPIPDEALRAHYDKVVPRNADKEYKSRHILVDTEAEAKAIIDKLTLGEKFEGLAVASKDLGTRESGGDLGWNMARSYDKPFADALIALEKGKFTTAPVKTDLGYHVIQLEDVRTFEPPPFDKVKGQIAQFLQQQQIRTMIADLKAKAKIE